MNAHPKPALPVPSSHAPSSSSYLAIMRASRKRSAGGRSSLSSHPLASYPPAKIPRTQQPSRGRSPSPTSVGLLSCPTKSFPSSGFIPHDAISIIITFLSETPSETRRYALVSKSFNEASKHNPIWKLHSHRRWSTKWGFDKRWALALKDYKASVASARHSSRIIADNRNQYWYRRYLREEKDSKRSVMKTDEILRYGFDCRFWFHPHHLPLHLYRNRSAHVKYSGLRCSEGIVRFIKPPSGDTYMVGHRRNSKKNSWFLEETKVGCLLSFRAPFDGSCSPGLTYIVQRLDNWGWQMHSNYQVMRAVDKRFYSSNDANNASGGIDNDSILWSDYLRKLSFEERPQNTEAIRMPVNNTYSRREVPDLRELREFLIW